MAWVSYRCVCRLPLEGVKIKVKRNLKLLEAEKMVSAEDDYQELINAIAKVPASASQSFLGPVIFLLTDVLSV